MIGIIFATENEARPFLKAIEAFPICSRPFFIFKSRNQKILPCITVISGVGKITAAIATVELILRHGVEFIINAGICGALSDSLPSGIGSIYRISAAVEGDRSLSCSIDKREVFKTVSFFNGFGLKEAVLVTSDKSVFDDSLRYRMSLIGDLIDMEGAAVVRTASMYRIGCDLIKGVSDLANDGGIGTMKSNLGKVSLAIALLLFRAIKWANV